MSNTAPPDDASAIRQWYRDRIDRYGVTFESLSAGPLEREWVRHTVHSKALFGTEPEVLDIGCGIGRFYDFLKKIGRRCRYTGYDLVPEYLARCRDLYPEIRVEERNILDQPLQEEFDTIVASQVFNHRYGQAKNLDVVRSMLENAFSHCRMSVSIDMLSTYVDYEENHLFYYPPEKVFQMAKSITQRVVLRHDFAAFEFCIQLYRPGAPVI